MENSELKPIWGEEDQISLEQFNWDNFPQPEIENHENSVQESEGKFGDSSDMKKDKRVLDNHEISQLHLKKKNLIQFINNIGQLANEPISRDILSHCEKVPLGNFSFISADHIIKLAKNRVEKMIKNKRIKKNWSEEDIKILIWIVSKYCQMRGNSFSKETIEQNDWEFIANLIPGVSPKNCMFKWLGLKKNNLAENNWTTEQSSLLNALVKEHGLDKWGIISEELYEKNGSPKKIYRCPKQCRQHWNCYLDPKLKKGPWQKKEDILLLRSVKQLDGAKKWAQIVKLFNGRTENALKNRFNLIIDKEYKENRGRKKMSESQIIQNYLRKYEGSVAIQQNKLLILREKKQSLAQSKKSIRETPPTARRELRKVKKYESDSEEYDPREWQITKEKYKPEKKQGKVEKAINFDDQKISSFNYDNQDLSYENLFRGKKQEPIFEEEEDFELACNKIYEEKQIDFPQEDKNAKHLKSGPTTIDELGTNEENLNIDMNHVHIVSLDKASFQKLKTQFSHQKHQFFPCKVTDNNKIIKYQLEQE